MKHEIYDRNLEVLKEKYSEIYTKLPLRIRDEKKVIIDESVQGEKILAVNKNNHLYYLNSRYNESEYVENWIKKYENIRYNEIFFLFGVSNFSCAKMLADKLQDGNILMLYEPDMEIFIKALYNVDITQIFRKSNILLCVKGLNDKLFENFLLFFMNYSNMKLLNFCVQLNYENLYEEECKKVFDAIRGRCEEIVAIRNTDILLCKEFAENDLDNCNDMIEQYSLNELRKSFGKIASLENIPAFIVSAGPSLDKNIKDLKMVENKGVIIAVDTALRTLLDNDIKPDLVVTIDPHKPIILFAHKDFYDIPLVECSTSNSKIRYIHNGKRIYFQSDNNFMKYLYNKMHEEDFQCLETGGSVANNAFSLAHVLGFKKIILVGQDLAYPNHKGHVQGAYLGAEKKIDISNTKYFEVEDIYGNKVMTEANMQLYKNWFESQIVRYPYLKVIDATEGGAKINGTEIMTLKDSIERECKTGIDKKLIHALDKAFSVDEMSILKKEIDGIEDKLEEIRRELKNGIRKYEKLGELFRRNKVGTKEFQNVMGNIGEIVKMIDEEPVMGIVSRYNKAQEYEMLEKVNDLKSNLNDEIKDVVNNGIIMLNSYIKAIDTFTKDLCIRKEFDGKKYKNLIEELEKKIEKIKEYICIDDVRNINAEMKGFYNLLLEAIDMQYKYNVGNYAETIIVLKRIIDIYNNKEYLCMIEIIETNLINGIKSIAE